MLRLKQTVCTADSSTASPRHHAATTTTAAAAAAASTTTSSPPASSSNGVSILHGVRVVELSMVLAAPMACALMADMGAVVIKVEPPGGEIWRRDGPPEQFQQLNRGKRSIVLDTKKDPRAMQALKVLLATADVFVTNLRQQALVAQGLDYESLHHHFPRLVYAHLSAWGREGPKKDDPGYDIGGFFAATGLEHYSRPTDESDPARNLGGFGDLTTCRDLLWGVLAALFSKERTGRGGLVDACLLRSGIFSMGAQMLTALDLQSRSPPVATKARGRGEFPNPTYNCYRCADGEWIQMLGLETRRHLPILLSALGMSAADAEFVLASFGERAQWRQETVRRDVIGLLDTAFSQKTASEWVAHFDQAGVWHHKIMSVDEVTHAPQPQAAGAFVSVPGYDLRQVAMPVKFSHSHHVPRSAAPVLGTDTAEVLSELGLPEDTVRELVEAARPRAADKADPTSKILL
jgi:crotonobetainyl-CoA:carnitine CoA-transferase CaiB-like acyl-CoA transferase